MTSTCSTVRETTRAPQHCQLMPQRSTKRSNRSGFFFELLCLFVAKIEQVNTTSHIMSSSPGSNFRLLCRTLYDVIRSADLADSRGALWGAGAGDYRLFPRWLSSVDSTWFRRRCDRDVARSNDGPAGTICRTNRYD